MDYRSWPRGPRRRWLSGSRWAWQGCSFSASAKAAAGDQAKDAPIVTCCAVGYRSGAMAHRLRAAGYTQVQNLEGSIFQWANEHRPLVDGGERVTKVHPYTQGWGRLLAPEVRAALPKS